MTTLSFTVGPRLDSSFCACGVIDTCDVHPEPVPRSRPPSTNPKRLVTVGSDYLRREVVDAPGVTPALSHLQQVATEFALQVAPTQLGQEARVAMMR